MVGQSLGDGPFVGVPALGRAVASEVVVLAGEGDDGLGGGIAIGAGGTADIEQSTVSLNLALGSAGGFGGGLYSAAGAVLAQKGNKIEHNFASTAGDDTYSGGTIS